MIITDNIDTAADVATLLAQRASLSHRIDLVLSEMMDLTDCLGRIEDELEQRGLIVERATERKA